MEKEAIIGIINLLDSMLHSADKLEKYYKAGDMEGLITAKKEILLIKEEIAKILANDRRP